MSKQKPTVVLITTQAWPQVARLALRFAAYGCRVVATCPATSQLNQLTKSGQVAACYPLSAMHPLASIEQAIRRSEADFLVPADDLAVWLLHALCQRRPALLPLVERSIGSASGYGEVRSRRQLLSLAARLKIAVPATRQVQNLDDIWSWATLEAPCLASGEPEPFVIKKDGTFGGGGVRVVERLADLPAHWAHITNRMSLASKWKQRLIYADPTASLDLPGLGMPEISVQAYVEGVAANAMFACERGRILGSVQARVVASRQKTGPALMIRLMRDPRIEQAGRLLAEALQLSGFFGLDFILDQETGAPWLLEMNPRCTQLGHVAHAGQADLAGILWAQWTGREAPEAGHADLGDEVAFYPQALEWAADSEFLRTARYDVGAQDLRVVDQLPVGNPALHARLYRAMRDPIRARYAQELPARKAFYFEAAASRA